MCFTVQYFGNSILGFSFTGTFIPAGCGTLTILNLDGEATGLSTITISNSKINNLLKNIKNKIFSYNVCDGSFTKTLHKFNLSAFGCLIISFISPIIKSSRFEVLYPSSASKPSIVSLSEISSFDSEKSINSLSQLIDIRIRIAPKIAYHLDRKA